MPASLFGRNSSNPAPVARVLEGMELFSDCALVLVPPSDYETSSHKTVAVCAYLFGACDALGQMNRITERETMDCFRSFLRNRFPSVDPSRLDQIVSFVIDAKNADVLASFVNGGGQAIVEWSRGNSKSPLGLLNLLQTHNASEEDE